MHFRLLRYVMAGAAVFLCTPGAFAQQTSSGSARYIAQAEEVTVVGCIVPEHDWRKANRYPSHPINVDNNFILVDASRVMPNVSAAKEDSTSTIGTTGTTTPPAAAAANAVSNPNTYELIGSNEKLAKPFVGRRVEIAGTLKAQEMGPNGPTGGPSSTYTMDLRLRELNISSIKEATGAPCPSMEVKCPS
jgi:hypothetical protein